MPDFLCSLQIKHDGEFVNYILFYQNWGFSYKCFWSFVFCRKVKTVLKKDISSLMKVLNRSLKRDRWEGEPNREAVQSRVYFYSKLHHAKSSRFPWTLAWHAYQNRTSIWSTLWRLTNIWIDTKKLLCLFHFCKSQIPFQWEWMVTNGHPACPGSQVSATT